MRITVTGADGMLGHALMEELASFDPMALTEPSFALEDREGVIRAVADSNPEWVIHTAAMTNVDGCELDPQSAYAINALGTRNVALACAACGAGMIYISTDFVFGARHSREPIEAWERGAPLSAYGQSKYGGERYVEALAPRFMIARTAWLYGPHGTHFVGTILNRARAGHTLKVVNDQQGSPSYSRDVAAGIRQLLVTGVPGWYHVVNRGAVTWFEFAQKIAELAGLESSCIQPCSTEELGRPAPRPPYSVLSTHTFSATTESTMRDWKEALAEFIKGHMSDG